MDKAKRVRAALIGMDGVIDVFVNDDIAIQLIKDATLDEALVTELLAKQDVTVVELILRRDDVQ